MAHVADHLSVLALEQQYRSCTDVTAARHFQTIWLLAKGHEIAEVAATVSFARRWVERLRARYNAHGPQALGDLRRRNGTSPSILRPDLLDTLKARLREPPPDGGLWTGLSISLIPPCVSVHSARCDGFSFADLGVRRPALGGQTVSDQGCRLRLWGSPVKPASIRRRRTRPRRGFRLRPVSYVSSRP